MYETLIKHPNAVVLSNKKEKLTREVTKMGLYIVLYILAYLGQTVANLRWRLSGWVRTINADLYDFSPVYFLLPGSHRYNRFLCFVCLLLPFFSFFL